MCKRSLQLLVNCVLVSVILFGMPARSTIPISSSRAGQHAQTTQIPQVSAALDWFKPHVNWINDEQARLTEIPAPPFAEAQRAEAIKVLLAAFGLDVHLDKVG